jgi:hypothetical protein
MEQNCSTAYNLESCAWTYCPQYLSGANDAIAILNCQQQSCSTAC